MSEIPGMTISQSTYKLENGSDAKIAVFIYTGGANPREMLDYAVSVYVQNKPYHELVEANLGNPWMRIVLEDVNEMHQTLFDDENPEHRL